MGLISRTADLYYTFRFLKLLVTPWKDTEAFKLGILDKEGRILRRASTLTTDKEKSAYTMFHRLVFNIKRLLEKVPFGKSRIASYAAALYLIREQTGMSDEGLKKIMSRLDIPVDMIIRENTWFLDKRGRLQPGTYSLVNEAAIAETCEFLARPGSKVDVNSATEPVGHFDGIPIFSVKHRETGKQILVSVEDINR